MQFVQPLLKNQLFFFLAQQFDDLVLDRGKGAQAGVSFAFNEKQMVAVGAFDRVADLSDRQFEENLVELFRQLAAGKVTERSAVFTVGRQRVVPGQLGKVFSVMEAGKDLQSIFPGFESICLARISSGRSNIGLWVR